MAENLDSSAARPNALEFFGESLFNSAIAEPLRSVGQGSGLEPAPSVRAYDIPEPQTPLEWLGKTLGSGSGVVAPYLASKGLAHGALHFVDEFAGTALSHALTGTERSMLSGAVFGFIFTPSDDPNQSGLAQRFHAAITGAATFGSQHYFSNKLAGSLGIAKATALTHSWKTVGARLTTDVLSGAGAGFVNTQTSSVLSGDGLVFDRHLAENMGSFAVTGLALDGAHIAGRSLRARLSPAGAGTLPGDRISPALPRTPLLNHACDRLAEFLRGTLWPGSTTMAMAGVAGADGIFLSQMADRTSGGGDRPAPLRGTATRTRPWDKMTAEQKMTDMLGNRAEMDRSVARGRSTQHWMNTVLAKLVQDEGLEAKGWRYVATKDGSGTDMIGGDGVLFNVDPQSQFYGHAHLIDLTANPGKGASESAAERGNYVAVPALRQSGIFSFDPDYVRHGAVDFSNPDAEKWLADVRGQLHYITSHPAPFDLATTPLPDPMETDFTRIRPQVTNMIDWADRMGSADHHEFAAHLRKGPLTVIDGALNTFRSDIFEAQVRRASEEAIAAMAIARLTSQSYNPSPVRGGEQSTVRLVQTDKFQRFREFILRTNDGREARVSVNATMHRALVSVTTRAAITQSDASKLPDLERKRADRLQNRLKAAGINPRVFVDWLNSNQNMIRQGGAMGIGEPLLALDVRAVLQQRTEQALLGLDRKPAAPVKPKSEKAAELKPLDKALDKAKAALGDGAALHDLGLGRDSSAADIAVGMRLAVDEAASSWDAAELQAFDHLMSEYAHGYQLAVARVHELLKSLPKLGS